MAECVGCNVYRQAITRRQCLQAPDMVAMLMRNEYGLYLAYVQAQPLHPLHRFPAGKACVDQYSFLAVADIITVPVAARIQ